MLTLIKKLRTLRTQKRITEYCNNIDRWTAALILLEKFTQEHIFANDMLAAFLRLPICKNQRS